MIIDDSISFFAIYYHNCILNLNLSQEFKHLFSKVKYQNVILCQRDENNGYLLTQSLKDKELVHPDMRSYYFKDRKELRLTFKKIIGKIDSSEKIFYLLRSSDKLDMKDSEIALSKWKQEVKLACKT